MSIETLQAILNLMRLVTLDLSKRNKDENIDMSLDEFSPPAFHTQKADDGLYMVIDSDGAVAIEEASLVEAEICAFAWNVNSELQWNDLLPVFTVLQELVIPGDVHHDQH